MHYLLKKIIGDSWEIREGNGKESFGLYNIQDKIFEPYAHEGEILVLEKPSVLGTAVADFFKTKFGEISYEDAMERIEAVNFPEFDRMRFMASLELNGWWDSKDRENPTYSRFSGDEYTSFLEGLGKRLS